MEWRTSYLDIILVPLSIFTSLCYHLWLWRKVRAQPLHTSVGINSAGQRQWILAMMKNEKNNIIAVQSIRNSIMGSTLMATTSILLSCGLAAVLSSTYTIKKPLNDSIYGAQGELMMALKYVTILFFFLLAFVSYTLSVRFISQVNFLINVPCGPNDPFSGVTPEYICGLMDKASVLNTVGNRLFYAGLPLLLWIFGPVMVFLCAVLMVPILYNLDVVYPKEKKVRVGEMGLGDV